MLFVIALLGGFWAARIAEILLLSATRHWFKSSSAHQRYRCFGALGLGLLVTLVGCTGSRIPEYWRPTTTLHKDRSVLVESDLIPYRQLTREDFLATESPTHVPPSVRARHGAATCLVVIPDGRIRLRGRDGAYEAFVEPLRFEARMNRTCSYWNDDQRGQAPEYVLQHEQIHFAIAELLARELNEDADRIAGSLRATAEERMQAVEGVKAKLHEVIQNAAAELGGRGLEFDEDTSMTYDPPKQNEWARRIEAELAKSEP